jgi:hypothetical protein
LNLPIILASAIMLLAWIIFITIKKFGK